MTLILLLVSALTFAVAHPVNAQQPFDPPRSYEKTTLMTEPAAVGFVLDFTGRLLGDGTGEEKDGFYPAFGRIVSGAGWISIGPGYRQRVFGNRAVFDTSAAVSWRAYKLAQARFEYTELADGRVAVGTQVMWQDLTQVNYFGTGPDSSADLRSEYRLKTADVVGYASYKPVWWFTIAAHAGRLDGPTLDSPTGPFDRHYPDARVTFADDPAFGLTHQPSFAHGRISIAADTRDYPDHPARGGLYEAAFARYADLDLESFSFSRYEAEAAHFLPLLHDGLVLAVHGWTIVSDTGDEQTIPLYLMPSLGGTSTLRAYPNYRFHDRNLMAATVEARLALTTHIDTALFVDAGSVAHEIDQLRLANRSYGLGFRLHTHRKTTIRIDAARGREGWGVTFSLNDPFRLRRLLSRTAAIPFVP